MIHCLVSREVTSKTSVRDFAFAPIRQCLDPGRCVAHGAQARTRRRHHAPIGNHSFRATGITAYLANGGTLEHAQLMAAMKVRATPNSMTARKSRSRRKRSSGS